MTQLYMIKCDMKNYHVVTVLKIEKKKNRRVTK